MAEGSRKIDVEKLISYSNDLVEVLKDKKDIENLTRCLDQSESLKSSCDSDFNEIQTAIQDYQKKIDTCKQKTERAKSEIPADTEVERLQIELEQELEKERALTEELRFIANAISDLEHKRVTIEEQKQTLKKLKQDELKAEMKLSMYASVTNIIPNMDDQSKIAGYIVDRDKKVIDKFEYDPAKTSPAEIRHSIWKTIKL